MDIGEKLSLLERRCCNYTRDDLRWIRSPALAHGLHRELFGEISLINGMLEDDDVLRSMHWYHQLCALSIEIRSYHLRLRARSSKKWDLNLDLLP